MLQVLFYDNGPCKSINSDEAVILGEAIQVATSWEKRFSRDGACCSWMCTLVHRRRLQHGGVEYGLLPESDGPRLAQCAQGGFS